MSPCLFPDFLTKGISMKPFRYKGICSFKGIKEEAAKEEAPASHQKINKIRLKGPTG